MPDFMIRCLPCLRKEERKWTLPESRNITGYDVVHIEVPEKEKSAFEEIRPLNKELSLSEYMALYRYATDDLLPRPLYDCEYDCYFFLNDERFVVIQGWVPKKRAAWMRPPLPWLPKQSINLIGKFQEPKLFGRAKRYEVKEYQGPCCDNTETRNTRINNNGERNGLSDIFN